MDAHYQIAFSCISYLSASFGFFDISSRSEDMLRIRVIKRFHCLHHYANNFWFEHLLEAARFPPNLNIDILGQIKGLEPFWKTERDANHDNDVVNEDAAKEGLADRLKVLNAYPDIKSMVYEMLAFRVSLKNSFDPSKLPKGSL